MARTHDTARLRRTTHGAPAPPHVPRLPRPCRTRLVATLQVSVLKDVGQFVGPESGSNVELKRGDECHHMRKTSWLRLGPAGSPDSSCQRQSMPQPAPSLGQRGAWAALAGLALSGLFSTQVLPAPRRRRALGAAGRPGPHPPVSPARTVHATHSLRARC